MLAADAAAGFRRGRIHALHFTEQKHWNAATIRYSNKEDIT